jgi:hypothetical protein
MNQKFFHYHNILIIIFITYFPFIYYIITKIMINIIKSVKKYKNN